MKVKLTKLKESDDPLHPNNIEEGYTKIGLYIADPKVGEEFYMSNFRTSTVQKIIDANTFETFNSIYKWEVIND